MFNRVIYEHSTALITIAAFLVASTIFVTLCWRALRMGPRQVERMENLPFVTDTPPATHGPEPTSKPGP